jgi:mannose-6-phosphate isomerase-like protein (cupin superfamily)
MLIDHLGDKGTEGQELTPRGTMKIILASDRTFIPAGHENPAAPGVWKKVLFARDDLQAGRVQMINWARLPVGSRFANHYHEDMQEVFIILQGEAEITVGGHTQLLRRGDAIQIDAREAHTMRNVGDLDVDYIAMGITGDQGGRTVIVD